jgi:hypothetical protein
MVIVEPELTPRLLADPAERVLAELGCDQSTAAGKEIKNILDEFIEKSPAVLRLRGIYRILPVTSANKKRVCIENGSIPSPMFARMATESDGDRFIVFMIATAGDEWHKIFPEDDSLLTQYALDRLGSELAELAADLVEAEWRREAEERGLVPGSRFSPGYCDWELAGQRLIFDVLDAEKIGASLTEHYVMVPEKTVSAAALLAESLPAKVPCGFCKKECEWRRA